MIPKRNFSTDKCLIYLADFIKTQTFKGLYIVYRNDHGESSKKLLTMWIIQFCVKNESYEG